MILAFFKKKKVKDGLCRISLEGSEISELRFKIVEDITLFKLRTGNLRQKGSPLWAKKRSSGKRQNTYRNKTENNP